MMDIKKMFLAVQPQNLSDRGMLRFVWRSQVLLPRTSTGVVSSPFQAIWCLKEAAKLQRVKYPES